MSKTNVNELRIGGGIYCKHCGEYIYNSAFNMHIHLMNCEKNKQSESIDVNELWNADLNCKHNIIDAPSGGVKCTKCSGWFCF